VVKAKVLGKNTLRGIDKALPTVPIEAELLSLIIVSIFFTLLFEINKEEFLWSGIISFLTWTVTGLFYLVITNYPVVSLMFGGIAMIYIIRVTVQIVSMRSLGKKLVGE
jgi:uncharacterized membrane protein YjjB (DUF3815 family)